ncbi:MAG: ATP-dependent Clp protease adaptor ClpS [Deferribacteres bacterium]|nr:ATP-dependent Clp protease adaptor ClpS [candidate division KSB1 bacterium]MCB9503004.1 ATP-dependent Clp protease adaptor ClpS [Deferribacteres bacterium]
MILYIRETAGELPDTDEKTTIDEEQESKLQAPWKVLLYNDDIHSFEEVILQLIKAIGCDELTAESIALEAHFRGKAVAYVGEFAKCFRVMGILREIQLVVEIEG